MNELDVRVSTVQPAPYERRSKKRRIVGDLTSVAIRNTPRNFKPPGRVNSAIKYGLRFEKAFAQYMHAKYEALAHPWIEYADGNGYGVCQPDVVLVDENEVLVFECKATFTPRRAYMELSGLYLPVVERLFGMQARGVQVVAHLQPSAKKAHLVGSIEELRSTTRRLQTWKWAGWNR